ncbi:MAG: hypothetical protein WBG81_10375 [Rhodanobacter sp.]
MKQVHFIRIVRLSACYDMLATWPFATPWTFAIAYAQLSGAAKALGLPGATPPLDVMHTLLANLLGSVVLVWSLARLLRPSVALGRLDAVARLLFATWQIQAVHSGASQVILAFTAFELLFGALQLLPTDRCGAVYGRTQAPPGKISIASPYEKKR